MNALEILSNLPDIVLYWASINLSWGIVIGLIINKFTTSPKPKCLKRTTDRYIRTTIWSLNAIMVLFLFIITGYDPGIMDMMIVVNTFITCMLTYTSHMLARWYKQLPTPTK